MIAARRVTMADPEPDYGRSDQIQSAFNGLDEETLATLRRHAEMKTYPADAILVHEGEVEDRMYVVTRGRVVITQAIGPSDDRVLAFRGPSSYFGEMALLTDQRRSASVRTVVETEVMEVTKEIFDMVLRSSPLFARSLLRTVILNLREADRAVIADLKAQQEELARAYEGLREAQEGIVAKERMQRELEIAGDVQRSLLPGKLPDVANFEFAARFEPASSVGGDFFDVMMLPDGKVGVLLADVSDKGAHAALFMAVTRTLFRTEARRQSDPVAVLQAVHDGLLDVSTSDMFVTALYGILDLETRLFRYGRAGQDEPLWVTSAGEASFLGGKGRFLGMWPGEPVLEERLLEFGEGDCLVVYSDGVTDMTDPSGEEFGRERLEGVVRQLRARSAEEIAEGLFERLQDHRKTAESFDDVAFVIVRAV